MIRIQHSFSSGMGKICTDRVQIDDSSMVKMVGDIWKPWCVMVADSYIMESMPTSVEEY